MDYSKVLTNSRGKGFVITCTEPNSTGIKLILPSCPLEEGKKQPHAPNQNHMCR